MDFDIKNGSLIFGRKSDLVLINNKKTTYHLVDFVVPANHREKAKASKNLKQILGSYSRAEKVVNHGDDGDAKCNVCNGLQMLGKRGLKELEMEGRVKYLERKLAELKIKGRIETIQTIAMLKSGRILRRVLVT